MENDERMQCAGDARGHFQIGLVANRSKNDVTFAIYDVYKTQFRNSKSILVVFSGSLGGPGGTLAIYCILFCPLGPQGGPLGASCRSVARVRTPWGPWEGPQWGSYGWGPLSPPGIPWGSYGIQSRDPWVPSGISGFPLSMKTLGVPGSPGSPGSPFKN